MTRAPSMPCTPTASKRPQPSPTAAVTPNRACGSPRPIRSQIRCGSHAAGTRRTMMAHSVVLDRGGSLHVDHFAAVAILVRPSDAVGESGGAYLGDRVSGCR